MCLWIIHICEVSPLRGFVSAQCHRVASCSTCHTDTHKPGRKVMKDRELKTNAHAVFSLSVIHVLFHSNTFIHSHCLVFTFLHMLAQKYSTWVLPGSELKSKVPIAFLIRIALSRVYKSKLPELQLLRIKWIKSKDKKSLISCIVAVLHLANSPVV